VVQVVQDLAHQRAYGSERGPVLIPVAPVRLFQKSSQAVQKGRPARPQQAKRRIVLSAYVEPLSAARTLLVDFVNSLLDENNRPDRQRSVHDGSSVLPTSRESLYAPRCEGVFSRLLKDESRDRSLGSKGKTVQVRSPALPSVHSRKNTKQSRS
jgi:hypothetical protein